jgi:Taurine catabolism dioxygenase TauD, TfdA family
MTTMPCAPDELAPILEKHVAKHGWMRLQFGSSLSQYAVPELEQWLIDVSQAVGALVPQSYTGKLIAQIRNEGANYQSHKVRGHQTDAELAPHSDRCDWNLLLYVQPAKTGGDLAIIDYGEAASALHKENETAYSALFEDFPFDLRVERIFSDIEWHCRPILWRNDNGQIRGHYIRRFINDSQRHPDCPRLSAKQISALDAFDSILQQLQTGNRFRPESGDLVILDNYRVMHARTAFIEDPNTQRLALRTWVAPNHSEQLPHSLKPLVGSCNAGVFRGGVSKDSEFIAQLGRPLSI